jgi:tripartite-type tricarboxylate transporter receptor subunit TctC
MVRLTRRAVVVGAIGAPFGARAQTPSVIKVIVPFPPGGSVDAIARLVQQGLQQRLGATIVIENKSGASGSIGSAQVAKSLPDGATWLFVFDTHAVNPSLQPSMPFDSEKDLDPVLLIGTAPNVLAAHPSRPWKSLSEVIEAAKAKAETVSFASIGTGSLGHLTMALLGKRAGVRWTHVPYRGGGPAMNDAIAGHVDMIIGSAALVTTQIKAGALRGIVQTGAERLPNLSDVPTAIESGFEKFESYAWWGVYAPAGTPKPMIDKFGEALTASLKDERVAKQVTEAQQITMTLGGPEQLRAFFIEQMRIWGAVVRENNIKAEG